METETGTVESSDAVAGHAIHRRPERGEPSYVSVIVPTHDRTGVLRTQLEALARQDFDGDWEVVVVDNLSPVDVESIVRGFEGRLPVRYVSAPDKPNVDYARNVGAHAAKGDLLVYCDCDDAATPGWLGALVAAAREGDLVNGAIELRRFNDPERFHWHHLATPKLEKTHGFMPIAIGCSMAVWRDVLDEVGGWDERFREGGDDVELSWRVQLAGYRLVQAPGAVMHYRFRPTLKTFMRQHYRRGKAQPALFALFRDHGMPRTDTKLALRTWVSVLIRWPFALFSDTWRSIWAMRASQSFGRLVGSIRARVIYL